MHKHSYLTATKFAEEFLDPVSELRILDVGAADINGTYRPIFDKGRWAYKAMDVVNGPNVDIVVADPYNWELELFDVIVCGSVLEHVEKPWLLFDEIAVHLRPNGLAFVLTHAQGPEHRHPVDCFRFLADGLNALAVRSGLTVLHCWTNWAQKTQFPKEPWVDTTLIARK